MEIIMPIDADQVRLVIAAGATVALLAWATIYIGFILARRLIQRLTLGVESDPISRSSRKLSAAYDYIQHGTDERKMRRAMRLLDKHGVDY